MKRLTSIVQLLWYFIFGVCRLANSQFRNSKFSGLCDDTSTPELVIFTGNTRGRLHCFILCTLDDNCVSLEYNKQKRECTFLKNVSDGCLQPTNVGAARVDMMWSDWCHNGGTPQPNGGCDCASSTTGQFCQIGCCGYLIVHPLIVFKKAQKPKYNVEIKSEDACDQSPCQNNGTCMLLPGSYKCVCPAGFTGIHCQTDLCDPSPCQNYGTCIRLTGSYACNCIAGFTGINCQTDTGPILISTLVAGGGGTRGDWHTKELCPTGTYATAFRVKVEAKLIIGDDTAVNGVELTCTSPHSASLVGTVNSYVMQWGSWGNIQHCPSAYYLNAFNIRVHMGSDSLGVTDLTIQCRGPGINGTSTTTLSGGGLAEGSWGSWSGGCPTGSMVCGISIRNEAHRGAFTDDSAVNDFKLYCCDY